MKRNCYERRITMQHIGQIIDDYTVIACHKPKYSNNSVYTLSNGNDTISLYYQTFRRLLLGKTTIENIKLWRNLRSEPKHLAKQINESKLSGHLNKYGYYVNKKTHAVEANEWETQILNYIQFSHYYLNQPINKIVRALNKNKIKYKKKGKWSAKRIQKLL